MKIWTMRTLNQVVTDQLLSRDTHIEPENDKLNERLTA